MRTGLLIPSRSTTDFSSNIKLIAPEVTPTPQNVPFTPADKGEKIPSIEEVAKRNRRKLIVTISIVVVVCIIAIYFTTRKKA